MFLLLICPARLLETVQRRLYDLTSRPLVTLLPASWLCLICLVTYSAALYYFHHRHAIIV